jgi:hypothetical protein
LVEIVGVRVTQEVGKISVAAKLRSATTGIPLGR